MRLIQRTLFESISFAELSICWFKRILDKVFRML